MGTNSSLSCHFIFTKLRESLSNLIEIQQWIRDQKTSLYLHVQNGDETSLISVGDEANILPLSEIFLKFYFRNQGSSVCHRENVHNQNQTENVN